MNSVKDALREIEELTRDAGTEPMETTLPGVLIIKGEVPAHQLAAVYEPIIGFTLSGTKVISIGDEVIHATSPSYYVIPTDIPATGLVRQGVGGRPYLSAGLKINLASLLTLLKDLPQEPGVERDQSFSACTASPEFIEVWLRLFRLLKSPKDIPALFPAYEREILYHVLSGPQGWRLRQLCLLNGKTPGIHQAVKWIRNNFTKAIDIKPIAQKWGMGVTTFHRRFKLVTGLSPIQFQKQLRLLEARRLISYEGFAVASAAYEVGYQSASQFNREYTRFFGASPARDTAKLKNLVR
ncbi:MAG: AraC family transcriptional regulator [Bdellovibrio sp.]